MDIITTETIRLLLKQYYERKKAHKLFFEVKRSTGYIKPERFADALAVSLFPSNGITLTGFEIKASRNDLLSELRDLSKSDAIKQFCDYWILIVTDLEILKGKIKVPDDWGIWFISEFYAEPVFITERKPKQLYPKPTDRYFLASLLNQVNEI